VWKPVVVLLGLSALGVWAAWSLGVETEPADITYVVGTEPQTLDPALATHLSSGRILLALFEGLTTYDPRDLTPRPGVARSWTTSPDGTTYTFHLRDSCWSQGDPVTAHDFVYAWRRLLDPETAGEYASLLFVIRGARAFHAGHDPTGSGLAVRAQGPRVLRVELEHPTPYFLDLTSFWPLVPVHPATVEAYGDRWTRPEHIVTNGPFRLAAWRFYHKLRLVRNETYWDAANVRTRVIDGLIADDANTGLLLYETGVAQMITSVPRLVLDDLREREDVRIGAALGTYFYRVNVRRPPLNDARVRRALARTIDRERIVRTITRGGEPPALRLVPPGTAGRAPMRTLEPDVATARVELAQAGFPGGKGFPTLTLLVDQQAQHRHIAEVVQACWREGLGIPVEILTSDQKGLASRVRQGDFWVVRSLWLGDYNDPTTFLDVFRSDSGTNRTGWACARYDRLLESARRAPDPDRRRRLLAEAEAVLVADETPILPVFFLTHTNMVHPSVRGVYDNVRNLHPLKYVYVETP